LTTSFVFSEHYRAHVQVLNAKIRAKCKDKEAVGQVCPEQPHTAGHHFTSSSRRVTGPARPDYTAKQCVLMFNFYLLF
jgi:hypothetical protein